MAAGDSHRQLQVPRSHPRSRRDVDVSREPQGPDELQQLQTTVGNRGMQQLLGGVRGLIGEGTPLPAALRVEHEQRFGADLADVRVHDHASAHRLAHGQLARAFTLGSDIVFNKDFYRPGTLAGRRLIAHELAHVVQQRAGGTGGSGPAHEAAADAVAQAAVSGRPGPVHAGPAAATGVQREPLSAYEIARLDQDQLRARLLANEKEAEFMMNSEEYNQRLYRENLELKRQIQAQARLQGAVAPAATGPIKKEQGRAQLPPNTFPMSLEGTTTFYVRGVAVLRFPAANASKVKYRAWIFPEHPDITYIYVRADSDSGARVDQTGLSRIGDCIGQFETVGVPLGEQDGGIQRGDSPLTPAKPPLKPVAMAKPAPKRPHAQLPPSAKIEEAKSPGALEPLPATPASDTAPLQPANRLQPLTASGQAAATGSGPAPPQLDLSDRAATVRKNLESWTFNISWRQDIISAFKDLSPDDFLRLQTVLGEGVMNDVFEQLSPFYSTLVGTYGPVAQGRDKLNQKRVDFIEDIRSWGAPKEAYYRWMFESMTLDDMHVVLRKLGDDQRLRETILTVPGLADELVARGVAPSELTEKDISVGQGIGRGLGHFWDSAWSGTVFAKGEGFESTYLPTKYQELHLRKLGQDFESAMTPTNVARGAASNMTLGLSDIPVGVYDASKLTIEAAQDLWNGKSGAAAEKLTPVVVTILTALIVHKISKSGAPATALEESKGLAKVEGAALAEPKTPQVGGGVPEWDVRKVGQTAEGADRYIGRHANGEFVELIVDPKKQTIRATRLATGEVVSFDNGQISRGSRPQLTAGEGSVVTPTAPAMGEPALVRPEPQVQPSPGHLAPNANQASPKQLGSATSPPLTLAPGLMPPKLLPPGPLAPLQLKPWFEDDFSDLGRELSQTPGSSLGMPTIWSVTPDGVVFATPPLRGVPLYAPPGTLLPPSSYFSGQPRSWTLSGPLQPNFTPFDVLPGQSATSRSLSQVRGARGPNARGAAGELHTAELSVGSRREVTLDLPADLARRSDVLSPTVAGTVNQEVKNYLRFRGSGGTAREVEWTPFMQTEINRDAMIMYYYGQQPVWVFTDAPPSQALRLALDQAGIPYVVSTDRLSLP